MKKFNISHIDLSLDRRLSILEYTIYSYILDKLENNPLEIFTLHLKDLEKYSFEDIFGVLKNLNTKKIYYTITTSTENIIGVCPLISSIQIKNETFYLTIPKEIRNSFKKNTLENVIHLKTFLRLRKKTAIIFFNIFLKNALETGTATLSISELKEVLQIQEDSYTRFFDFEKIILKPIMEEINRFSDFQISYEKIKSGNSKNNKVLFLKFKYINITSEETTAETNYLIQLLKHSISDFHKIWKVVNETILRLGFYETKKLILFLKQNSVAISDDDLIEYLNRNGDYYYKIFHLSSHALIKEKNKKYKSISEFLNDLNNEMVSLNFYYSLNFKFIKMIKNIQESENIFYQDNEYLIIGNYSNQIGSYKIFKK